MFAHFLHKKDCGKPLRFAAIRGLCASDSRPILQHPIYTMYISRDFKTPFTTVPLKFSIFFLNDCI